MWIAGGLAKGADVDELVAKSAKRLRGAVLIGTDRAQIREALARHAPEVPVVDLDRTDTGAMLAAVRRRRRLAAPGDTVLLAPAWASMDMFADYNERGDAFAEAVRELGAGTDLGVGLGRGGCLSGGLGRGRVSRMWPGVVRRLPAGGGWSGPAAEPQIEHSPRALLSRGGSC